MSKVTLQNLETFKGSFSAGLFGSESFLARTVLDEKCGGVGLTEWVRLSFEEGFGGG